MSQRASIFEDTLEVDVSDFAPKKRPDTKAPTQEQVRAVAEAANFPSRQVRDVRRRRQRRRWWRNPKRNASLAYTGLAATCSSTSRHHRKPSMRDGRQS
jgi:hypothetical protein